MVGPLINHLVLGGLLVAQKAVVDCSSPCGYERFESSSKLTTFPLYQDLVTKEAARSVWESICSLILPVLLATTDQLSPILFRLDVSTHRSGIDRRVQTPGQLCYV